MNPKPSPEPLPLIPNGLSDAESAAIDVQLRSVESSPRKSRETLIIASPSLSLNTGSKQ